MPRYFAILPAAGHGDRFGGDKPKQYSTIEGKTLIEHSIDRLRAAVPLAGIYVALAIRDSWFDDAVSLGDDVVALRCGGSTRAVTVAQCLNGMVGVADDDWVLVHDTVRPCVDRASLMRLIDELVDDDVGGLLAVPAADTLKRADGFRRSMRTESREGVWLAQTPQMFRCGVLRTALARPGSENATDEAQAVEALGMRPRLVLGSRDNVKVTYPDDLILAAAILELQARRNS